MTRGVQLQQKETVLEFETYFVQEYNTISQWNLGIP